MLLPPLRSPVPTVSLLTCEPVPTVHPNPRRGAPSHGGHLSTSSTAPPPGCLRHVPALLVGVAASFLGRPRPQREPEASNWGPAWALPPPGISSGPCPRPAPRLCPALSLPLEPTPHALSQGAGRGRPRQEAPPYEERLGPQEGSAPRMGASHAGPPRHALTACPGLDRGPQVHVYRDPQPRSSLQV